MERLLYLLCPLMMLFCMKGMFSGGKKDCTKKTSNSSDDIKSLHMQVQILQEQNTKLMEDMKSLKTINQMLSQFLKLATRTKRSHHNIGSRIPVVFFYEFCLQFEKYVVVY
ncbi:hypothetical protein GCM10009865_43480 [Aeromicrobium ponti]|uniref:Uncharacterized protein n=1 Tax=Cytobacillus oceanisediminis TaxID=665099 RepID=A0A562JD05_9BACI|nr:Protein of unknown function (DUF2933) [Cytobacillus oceanisediminis]